MTAGGGGTGGGAVGGGRRARRWAPGSGWPGPRPASCAQHRTSVGTVPQGRRTLPAWTVTGSVKLSPPALIVTSVVPALKAQNRPDSGRRRWIGSSLGPPSSTALASGDAVLRRDEVADFGVRGAEGVFGRDPVRTAGCPRSSPGSGCRAPIRSGCGAAGSVPPPAAGARDRRSSPPGCGAGASPPGLPARVRRRSGSAALPPGATFCSLPRRHVDVDQQEPAGAEEVLQLGVAPPRSSRASPSRRPGSRCCRAASRCSVRARRRSRPRRGRR